MTPGNRQELSTPIRISQGVRHRVGLSLLWGALGLAIALIPWLGHTWLMMVKVANANQSDLSDIAGLFARLLRGIPYYNAPAKEGEAKKYTGATLTGKLAEDPNSVLVARDPDGTVVGFCFSHFDDFTIWIDWFGVDASSRQRGVGTAILKKIVQTAPKRRAHKVWCDTRADNEPSKRLLQKMGFTRLVEIKNHWYGQDFILWERFV